LKASDIFLTEPSEWFNSRDHPILSFKGVISGATLILSANIAFSSGEGFLIGG
jgi:hypothetical protein